MISQAFVGSVATYTCHRGCCRAEFGNRWSLPRPQISSFPQHAIPQIARLSPSILAPPHRLSPASFNISFMLYFDFVTYVDIATASVLAVALQHRDLTRKGGVVV